MMRDIFPRQYRNADIIAILRADYIKQSTKEFKKEIEKEPSKLWLNHFQSVKEFNNFLWRIGGLKNYRSFMEKIRSKVKLATIKVKEDA